MMRLFSFLPHSLPWAWCKTACLALLVCVCAAASPLAQAQRLNTGELAESLGGFSKDGIAAVVNDHVITAHMLLRRAALNRRQFSGELTQTDQAKLVQDALYELIDEHLKTTHAKALGHQASRLDIARAQRQLEQLNGLEMGAYARLIKGLEAEGLAKLQAEILWQKVLQGLDISGADIPLSPAFFAGRQPLETSHTAYTPGLTKSLPTASEQTSTPVATTAIEAYELSQIFTTEEARNSIDALALQLQTGMADFAELAQTHNADTSAQRGGYVGWVETNTMAPSLQSALETMAIGDVSAPIQSPAGWHIVRLERLRQTQPETQSREALVQQQKMARRQQKARALMAKLRQEAFIEVKLPQS